MSEKGNFCQSKLNHDHIVNVFSTFDYLITSL